MTKSSKLLDAVKEFNIRRKIVDTVIDISLNGVDPSVAKQKLGKEVAEFKQLIRNSEQGLGEDGEKYKADIATDLREFGRRLQLIGESISQEIQILINDLK